MRRNFIKKILIVLLLIVLLLESLEIFFNNVQATVQELETPTLNEILESEEKIMMYDARTNETTEVDMEQLRQTVALKNKARGISDINSIAPYDPYSSYSFMSKNVSKNGINSLTNVDDSDPGLEYGLTRVKNTALFPNRSICWIKTDAETGGTCSIVGPNIGLTAAHCVFRSDANDRPYMGFEIYAAFDVDKFIGPATGWTQVFYPESYLEEPDTNKRDDDWAIIILGENIGNKVGWFGVQGYGTSSEMEGLEVNFYGYPGVEDLGFSKTNPAQYFGSGTITSFPALRFPLFTYSGAAIKGMSGGPITRASDNYIVGIIKGNMGDLIPGYGVPISKTMMDIIIANTNN